MSSIGRACALAALLGLGSRAQDPRLDFAREALALLRAGDDELLSALTLEFPEEARRMVHELLWESLRAGPAAGVSRNMARRMAAALSGAGPDGEELLQTVERAAQQEAEHRSLQRAFDRSFLAATEALQGGDPRASEADARSAVEGARALGLAYLEMRARRLLAETLRGREGADAELRKAVELARTLGLATEEREALEALAEAEIRESRLRDASAHLEQAERLARAAGDEGPAALLLARRGGVLASLGRAALAHEMLDAACATFERLGDPAHLAFVRLRLAGLASRLGRYAEAITETARARRAFEEAGDAHGVVESTLQLAGIYSELGLEADATDALLLVRERIAAPEFARERPRWLLARGLVELDAGRAGEALATLDGLLAELSVQPGHGEELIRSEAERHRAAARLRLGDAVGAEAGFRSALGPGNRLWDLDPLRAVWARTGLGDAQLAQEKLEQAEDSYARALDEAQSSASPEATWRARFGLGRVAEAQGTDARALEAYSHAIEDLETIRGTLEAPALRLRWLGDKLELYRRATRLLARAGRLEEAFRMAGASQARTLLELGATRPIEARRRDSRAEAERLREAEAHARLLTEELDALPRTPSAAEMRVELVRELDAARAAHEAARLELALAEPRRAVLLGLADAPALADVRAALAADERLLQFQVGPEGTSLFVVGPGRDPGGVRFLELATDEAALAALVERILHPIALLGEGRLDLVTLGFDARAARELHGLLLGPIQAELAGCHTLWIVPDGPLRRLSFALLVSAREKRPVDPEQLFAQYEGCRFLIEDFALAHLPSAGLLVARGAPRPVAHLELLIVADPSPMPAGASALAGARAEAQAVAAGHARDTLRLLLGEEANEASVRAALPGARFLHLATHGLLDDRRPSWSRLAFAPATGQDGWLHAWEVQNLELAAERVVLSACQTLGEAHQGEGLAGLARAFLEAGAGSVVATSWAVDDQASAELLRLYGRALGAGEDALEALRTAQVGLLRGAGRAGVRYHHPYFWAGFLHLGSR